MDLDRWTVRAWVCTLILLALCLAPKRWVPPGERVGSRIPHQDKLVHFGLFAAFGLCWARAGRASGLSPARIAGVLAVSAVLAVGTEVAQGLEMIHRDPDPLDALADAAGAVAGVGLAATRGRT